MAFDNDVFGRISSSKSTRVQTIYGYNLDKTVLDDVATITASGYFNDLLQGDGTTFLKVGDLISFRATDAAGALRPVSAISPNINLTSLT